MLYQNSIPGQGAVGTWEIIVEGLGYSTTSVFEFCGTCENKKKLIFDCKLLFGINESVR